MSSGNRLVTAEAQGSLCEVIGVIEVELCVLFRRLEEVSRRMRKLHLALAAIHELVLWPAVEGPHSGVQKSMGGTAVSPWALNRTAATVTRYGFPKETKRNRDQTAGLRRACRIALLENSELMSAEEIYSRIVRRGSFTFANDDVARLAIAKELDTLTREGEARCWKNAHRSHWQRVIRDKEIDIETL